MAEALALKVRKNVSEGLCAVLNHFASPVKATSASDTKASEAKSPPVARQSRSASDRILAHCFRSRTDQGRSAQGRLDPFTEPSANGRYLRIPAVRGFSVAHVTLRFSLCLQGVYVRVPCSGSAVLRPAGDGGRVGPLRGRGRMRCGGAAPILTDALNRGAPHPLRPAGEPLGTGDSVADYAETLLPVAQTVDVKRTA